MTKRKDASANESDVTETTTVRTETTDAPQPGPHDHLAETVAQNVPGTTVTETVTEKTKTSDR